MNSLSDREIRRQDIVDEAIFELISKLNPSTKRVKWNIEMIADIRDRVQYWLVEYYRVTETCNDIGYIRF